MKIVRDKTIKHSNVPHFWSMISSEALTARCFQESYMSMAVASLVQSAMTAYLRSMLQVIPCRSIEGSSSTLLFFFCSSCY